MGNTKSWVAHWATIFVHSTKAFFAIEKEESTAAITTKVAKTAAMRTFYAISDYWLMAASAAYIVLMHKWLGYGWLGLFFLMWAFDIIVANVYVVIWKRTGEDVTLGESFRRAVDAIHERSRVAGYVAFVGVLLKATFWDGPEHIVIFFHKELKTERRMLLVLIALTAVQAAIWTPIFVLGFDSVAQLFHYLVG